MYDILQGAREELREWVDDNPDHNEPHDRIFEIADGWVPVYHSELIDLAGECHSLATDVPELGPAFSGEPTPVNIIAANVFEMITADLWEEWNKIEEQLTA